MYRVKTRRGSVIEVKGLLRRKLLIDGFPQTQMSFRHDWKTILRRSRVEDMPSSGCALVLGLGGGDLANVIEKLRPNWSSVFVELELEVAKVAEKYFGIGSTTKRKIVVSDASKYMEINVDRYDLIVVDVYCGDDVPAFVSGDKFIREVAKALKPGGKVIFNYASHGFGEDDFEKYERKLKAVFGSVTRLKTWGHTYFLASKV